MRKRTAISKIKPAKLTTVLYNAMNTKIIINVTFQEHDLIKSAAQADSRSINAWCKLTLLAKIQGSKQVIDNLAPGEVVIVHKRGIRGLFESKNKKGGNDVNSI